MRTDQGIERFLTFLCRRGRFVALPRGRGSVTLDPSNANVDVGDPGSWNRYAYTNGDPVNGFDRTGLEDGDDDDNGGLFGSAYFAVTVDGNCAPTPLQNTWDTLITNVSNAVTAVQNNPFAQIGASAFFIIGGLSMGNEGELDEGVSTFEEGASALISEAGSAAPDFVVSEAGDVIPVPEGATGPFETNNGSGVQFNGGAGGNGLANNVTDVRIMNPNPSNPSGYVNYGSAQANGGWQTVDPYTGQAVSNSNPWWHIPLGDQ